MTIEQNLLFLDKTYQVLQAEQEFIIHPAALGLLPLNERAFECSYTCTFQIVDYHLYLDQMTLNANSEEALNMKESDNTYRCTEIENLPIKYNGAILIGTDMVKDYQMKGFDKTCFSYQSVYELIFEDGVLITTVDQNKAMTRIRKNIELGLRSLVKNRDVRCIKRFMSESFVGDYRPFLMNYNRMRYLKEMKKDYKKDQTVKLISCSKSN